MKKIKILRIITRLNIGGPAIHATLLTKEFNDGKFESRLLSGVVSEREGNMDYVADASGIKPLYVKALRREINIFRDLISFCQILKLILRYKPDIVHTHTAKAGTLGRIAAIVANVPVKVHTFHGHVFWGYFKEREAKFFVFVEKILAKFTDAIIAISPRQKEEIVSKYKIIEKEKCHVIRLGFDLGKFLDLKEKRNTFRRRFKFKDDDILIGHIGRLVPIKNHRMFIDAVYHMKKKDKDGVTEKTKFVIIGDGEMREELLAYTRFKGLKNHIYFTGWVKDIGEAYADLDIISLTSINEGTPVALIEAMSSAKPVVSTDVGGVSDAVTEGGMLVGSGDYRALAAGIRDLVLLPQKREELGNRGKDFVKNVYSKDRLVKELRELYHNLLAKKKNI